MNESLNYALVALAASAIATTVGSSLSTSLPELFKGRVSGAITETMERTEIDSIGTVTIPGKATISATTLDPCNLQTAATTVR